MGEVGIGGCLGHSDYESVKIAGAVKKAVSRDATKSRLLADQVVGNLLLKVSESITLGTC